ncbi:hypothetical protein OF897_11215 [Chryseobacterium formosus]|uniref:Lipoprotein n=1 Tax=Chryseobacterium formosus TaxID=1537363 RepID=A0ABT3XQS6_9FLAO|nr:hypothetical protein [Chryseobacterium formosus]MCX8524481.1 hypothetical protein [Chryseobacterium formosus]
MKKVTFLVIIVFLLSFQQSCKKSEEINITQQQDKVQTNDTIKNVSVVDNEIANKPQDFVPKGFKLFEKTEGDLNNDGITDCVLMIKGTDKSKFVNDEYRGELDRNRRGLIILFKKGNQYYLALKNDTCFSSENEEGGVYYAPELDVSVEKGKLFVHYAHGRYGYWTYTFQYRNSDFYLIGYDSSDNHGPIVNSMTSINYLTGKKQIKDNINKSDPDADEVFEETWTKIESKKLTKLSEIKDFDDLL